MCPRAEFRRPNDPPAIGCMALALILGASAVIWVAIFALVRWLWP